MERSTVHLLHKRGKSLREIASELGRSKTTIARALSGPVDRQAETRRRLINWLTQRAGNGGLAMAQLSSDRAQTLATLAQHVDGTAFHTS